MNISEMMETMRGVYVPGMGNEWCPTDSNPIEITLASHTIYTFGAEIDGREDAIWNSLRFAYCEAVHAAITYWHDEIGILPSDYDELDAVPRELVDACLANSNPANIPWHLFRHAMTWPMPEAYYMAEDAVLEQDWDRRYEFEVRHRIELDPDGIIYRVTTQIGGGWQDIWAATYQFTISKYASHADFIDALRLAYPDYLTEDVMDTVECNALMLEGYKEAMVWADAPHCEGADDRTLENMGYTVNDFSDKAEEAMRKDIAQFHTLITCNNIRIPDDQWQQVGMDLFFSRQGLGTDFRDHRTIYGKANAERLSRLVRDNFHEVYAWIDNDKIVLES